MQGSVVPSKYICAGTEYSTKTSWVAAPLFRKKFFLSNQQYETILDATITIGVCGFYELYLNGQPITKGKLAPYICALDDLIYYDLVSIADRLRAGENTLGIWLGNGLRNNPGGALWGFDQARWRGSPCFALELSIRFADGTEMHLCSDETFLTADSPILFDDYRIGEVYDANMEKPGWSLPDYDDSAWSAAIQITPPRGEPVLCKADPIRVAGEYRPVRIFPIDKGWLFDFGFNSTGVIRLKIHGKPGQKIVLHHGEDIRDGTLNIKSTTSDPNMETNVDTYICRGGEEEYQPRFTYHGFQYVYVEGLCEDQIQDDTLTYVEFYSDLPERGDFSCSLERANRIQKATRKSTLSNFQYFPNDCPQREKNGWTGDVALSAEHTMLNLEAERSYTEWMRSVRKAQNRDGALPGIIPTGGWGYGDNFHGPAWDCVLTEVPYQVYKYRGDRDIVLENASAISAYLNYLSAQRMANGLVVMECDGLGLGDWAQVGKIPMGISDSPLELVHTLMALDSCAKAEYLFEELGLEADKKRAQTLKEAFRQAVRKECLDLDTMRVRGNCQTSQTLGLAMGLFEADERELAFQQLLTMIRKAGDSMDVGVIGGRYLFHVLSAFGYSELAFSMITKPDYPSYGNWIERGATTLWEEFQPEDGPVHSKNHHFWGDVSHWFIRWLAGIHYGRTNGQGTLQIRPAFISQLQWAEGWHQAPEGEIRVRWERAGTKILLHLTVPDGLAGSVVLPEGTTFEDSTNEKPAKSGMYIIG